MKRDPQSRTLLVLDEDPDTLELMLEPLRWEGYDVKGFSSPKEATEALNYMRPSIIVVDPDFSSEDGTTFVNNLMPLLEKSTLMIVSSQPSTEKITQFLDMGAADFIAGPIVPLEFLARIRTQLRLRDLQEELIREKEKLQELVEVDDLTGLFNTRSLYQKLEFEIERVKRFQRPVSVVMIDVDNFKNVNDGHDHLFGSYVLSELGKIIRQSTRNIDIPARYGGDEFLIMLSEVPLSGIDFFCERLRQKVETHMFAQGADSIKLTLSIGHSTFDSGEAINARELVRRADAALYEAKHRGRNRVVSYDASFDRLHKAEANASTEIFSRQRKSV